MKAIAILFPFHSILSVGCYLLFPILSPYLNAQNTQDNKIEYVNGNQEPKQGPKILVKPSPNTDKNTDGEKEKENDKNKPNQPPKVDNSKKEQKEPKSDESLPVSKLATQVLQIPSKMPGIEIVPDKISVISTKRFQIITAKTDGKVKWLVFNKSKDPVEWLELPGTKSIQIFPTYGVEDEITIYAYTSIDGDPTDLVKSTVLVTKDGAKKSPSGDVENPDENVKPSNNTVLHFTIITDVELAKVNEPLATLIASKGLRSNIEDRKDKLWIMDQKVDIKRIKECGLDVYLSKVGKIPMYVIQNQSGAVVDVGVLPTTLTAILQKLDVATTSPKAIE